MEPGSSLWIASEIAARTGVVLVFLVLGFRLAGKSQIGQMNIYDLSLIMLVANAVQNAMTHGDGHLVVGLASAGVLLAAGRGLSILFLKLPRLEEHMVGSPTVIISDGRLVEENLRRESVTRQQVDLALREHELTDPRQVKLAILEVDGSVSIIPNPNAASAE